MRKFVGLLVIGFAMTLGGRAEAQVVTFNEMTPTSNPILGSVACGDSTGFRFFSDHFHVIGPVYFPQDYSSNDTTHIGYESGRGFPITMQRVGGGTFSLLSLDAAEFYSVPVPDRPDAQMLTITGFQQGGGTVSYTVNLDGVYDGPGGVIDFEHFVLPSTFVNLTSVIFTGLREGNVSGGVAVDNIAYQLASPEVLAPCVAIPVPPATPTVSITSPLPGNVLGTVLVEATASDNLGVTSVQFKLDGVDLGAADVDRALLDVLGYDDRGRWPAYDHRGSPRRVQQRGHRLGGGDRPEHPHRHNQRRTTSIWTASTTTCRSLMRPT